MAIGGFWLQINQILFDIAFVSYREESFLLLFDIVPLEFSPFKNYLVHFVQNASL